jgi:hypothetical protein
MTADEALRELKEYGVVIELHGPDIRVKVPRNQTMHPRVQTALETLRRHKQEVVLLMSGPATEASVQAADCEEATSTAPVVEGLASCTVSDLPSQVALNLPPGVRIVRYDPKKPPVFIDTASVVVDVERFIKAELDELDARLYIALSKFEVAGAFTQYWIGSSK